MQWGVDQQRRVYYSIASISVAKFIQRPWGEGVIRTNGTKTRSSDLEGVCVYVCVRWLLVIVNMGEVCCNDARRMSYDGVGLVYSMKGEKKKTFKAHKPI